MKIIDKLYFFLVLLFCSCSESTEFSVDYHRKSLETLGIKNLPGLKIESFEHGDRDVLYHSWCIQTTDKPLFIQKGIIYNKPIRQKQRISRIAKELALKEEEIIDVYLYIWASSEGKDCSARVIKLKNGFFMTNITSSKKLE